MLAVWLREKHKLCCIYRFSNTLILSIGVILKIFLEFRKFQPQYSYKIYSWNGDANWGNTNDRCSGNCNLSNCKVTRKQFRDFNWIRTHDPYIRSTPIELTKLISIHYRSLCLYSFCHCFLVNFLKRCLLSNFIASI